MCLCPARAAARGGRAPATPGGDFALRSLSPAHLAYHGDYGGDSFRRDSGYHQGPVWSWLIGGYVEAYARVYGDDAARAVAALRRSSARCMPRLGVRDPRR